MCDDIAVFQNLILSTPQIKATVNIHHYKYLLNHISRYHSNANFEEFWSGVMPMFKECKQKIYILRALRRFMATEHKALFDTEMYKNFIVE